MHLVLCAWGFVSESDADSNDITVIDGNFSGDIDCFLGMILGNLLVDGAQTYGNTEDKWHSHY